MKLIIFTDLDGTLLDHNTYSFEKAEEALSMIKDKGIPLIFCTSKTFEETRHFQRLLDINAPFIVENGGATYIPEDYFGFKFKYQREEQGYLVLELGKRYAELRKALNEIRDKGLDILGFGDMSPKEIAHETGLSLEQASMAGAREYDEPFKFQGNERVLRKQVKKKKLRLSKGGRYYHITGKNDKGKAVKKLVKLFKKKYKKEKIIILGLGDSPNDFDMLKVIKDSYLVQRPDKSYASENYIKAEDIGPKGWNKVIETKIREIFQLDKKR